MEHQHYHEQDLKAVTKAIWAKVCDEFAPKKEVYRLAKELRDLDCELHHNNKHVAKAVAAKVIEDTQKDLDKLRDDVYEKLNNKHSFEIVIVPNKDKNGRPKVTEPRLNVLYLCPSEICEYDDSWDEWIVIPMKCGSRTKLEWERIGAQKLDLKWVKNDIDAVNEALLKLNNRLQKVSDHLAKHILENCIKPLKVLNCYIHSDEFKEEVVTGVLSRLTKATTEQDGIMTKEYVQTLLELERWQAEDYVDGERVVPIINEILKSE